MVLSHPVCPSAAAAVGKQRGSLAVAVLMAQLCPTLCDPWTAVHQAPLSMKLPRQEYWSGLPRAPPGDRPHPGIGSCVSCLGRQLLFHGATWEAARGPQRQTPYSQAGVPTSSTPTARLGSPHPDPPQPGWSPRIQTPPQPGWNLRIQHPLQLGWSPRIQHH